MEFDGNSSCAGSQAQSIAVGVWSDSENADLPVLPEGYTPHPVDRHFQDVDSSRQIFIIRTSVASAYQRLEEARSALGLQGYFIVAPLGGASLDDRLQLMRAGAGDVIEVADREALEIALERASLTLAGHDVLRAETQKLRRERDALQLAIDNIPSPIFFKDRAGIYVGCNKAFEGFIGIPAKDVIGSSVYDVAPPELAERYETADEELMARGGVQNYEANVRYASGEHRHVSFHKGVFREAEDGDVLGLVGVMLDITERKELEDRLKLAAERDYLTNAYNRRKFFELAEELIGSCNDETRARTILVLDIDHFKQINDRFGHAAGDGVLRHLVFLLEELLAEPHIFARAGGEEFFCLLEGCDLEKAYEIADNLRRAVAKKPYDYNDVAITYRISIGLAEIVEGDRLSDVIIRADEALYEAKTAGRNRVESA